MSSRRRLRHKRYPNVFAIGDAGGMPNAKTAAAVRKQAPVVAINALRGPRRAGSREQSTKGMAAARLSSSGAGSCWPNSAMAALSQPTFPRWLIDGTRPTRFGWILKKDLMPTIYFDAMLKGHEWLADPRMHDAASRRGDAFEVI